MADPDNTLVNKQTDKTDKKVKKLKDPHINRHKYRQKNRKT